MSKEYRKFCAKKGSGNIKGRVLKLVINDNPLNSSQIENLKKVVENANKSGIKVEAILLK